MERQSNIELLRIVAMLFIAMHHFCVHAICPDMIDTTVPLTKGIALGSFFNAFIFYGVNCFVLISGYWGIRLNGRNVAKLYLTCVVYGLITYGLTLYFTDTTYDTQDLFNNSFLCITNNGWWFINCYFVLMALSPMLNLGLKQLNKKQLRWILLMWAVMEFYIGYYGKATNFDANGYTIHNFVFLYLISHYIHNYLSIDTIRKGRWWWLGIYIVTSLLWGSFSCWNHLQHLPWWYIASYNNPVVIFGSIALFLFFLSFDFRSRLVNWLAAGVLAAYLIQDHFVNKQKSFCYILFNQYFGEMSTIYQYLIAILLAIVLVGVAASFDHLRAWAMNPLIKRIPNQIKQA